MGTPGPIPGATHGRRGDHRCSRTTRQRQPRRPCSPEPRTGLLRCTRSRARHVPAPTWWPRRSSRAWSAGRRSWRELFAFIERLAPYPTTALITGESGTGKELVARAIHRLSAAQRAAPRRLQLHHPRTHADRDRAVRSRARRLHRRRPRSQGAVRGRARRHHLPRRDRRPARLGAGQAAARARGARDPPRRVRRRDRRSTSASSRPPTAISATWCAPASSATTSTTA